MRSICLIAVVTIVSILVVYFILFQFFFQQCTETTAPLYFACFLRPTVDDLPSTVECATQIYPLWSGFFSIKYLSDRMRVSVLYTYFIRFLIVFFRSASPGIWLKSCSELYQTGSMKNLSTRTDETLDICGLEVMY